MNFSKTNRVLISQFDFQVNDKIVWSQTNKFFLGLGIIQFENNNPVENATLFFALRKAKAIIIKKLCLKRATQFTMIKESELLNFSLPWCSKTKHQNFLLTILNTKKMKQFLKLGDLLFQKHKDSQIKIKDHFQLVRGKTPSTKNPEYYENGTIKWINSGVLTNLYFLTDKTPVSKLVTEKAVKECRLLQSQPESIIFSNIGTNKERLVWVGCSIPFFLGEHIWQINNSTKSITATLFFALRQINFSLCSSGSVFSEVQWTVLLNMKINWVSNPAIQKYFYTILTSEKQNIKYE